MNSVQIVGVYGSRHSMLLDLEENYRKEEDSAAQYVLLELKDNDDPLRQLLEQLGVTFDSDGASLLYHAVKLYCGQKDSGRIMTKLIYPELARAFRTTKTGVEAKIRREIEKSWSGAKGEVRASVFGQTAEMNPGEKSRPSNGDYICKVSAYLKRIQVEV